jgi:hypothetical protein
MSGQIFCKSRSHLPELGAKIVIQEKLMSEISLFLLTKGQMKCSFHTEGKIIALLLGCGEDTDCLLLLLRCVWGGMVIGWTNKREGKDCGKKEGRRIYEWKNWAQGRVLTCIRGKGERNDG